MGQGMDTKALYEFLETRFDLVKRFDPALIALARDRIASLLGQIRYDNAVLAFSHSDYLTALGGTEKLIQQDQAELEKMGISYIQIYGAHKPLAQNKYLGGQIVGVNIDGKAAGKMSVNEIALALLAAISLKTVSLLSVHIHHLMNLDLPSVKFMIQILRPGKIRFFLHDYYSVCPQFNLLKNGMTFCGGENCDQRCQYFQERKLHLCKMKEFFRSLELEIISPSQVAAEIWSKSFPELGHRVRVVPHLVLKGGRKRQMKLVERIKDPSYKPKIAYLGYESKAKGLHTWWRMVSDERLVKIYEFYHLGAAGARKPNVAYVEVSYLEDGHDAMIQALKKHEIDISFLWSICAETFSFTLFESLAAGCFILTNAASGNIAKQIMDSTRGLVFEDESELFECLRDAHAIKDLLIRNITKNPPLLFQANTSIAHETARQRRKSGQLKNARAGGTESYLFRMDENMALKIFTLETAHHQEERPHCLERLNHEHITSIVPSDLSIVLERAKYWVRRHRVMESLARKMVYILASALRKEDK